MILSRVEPVIARAFAMDQSALHALELRLIAVQISNPTCKRRSSGTSTISSRCEFLAGILTRRLEVPFERAADRA